MNAAAMRACKEPTRAWVIARVRAGNDAGEVPDFGSVAWHKLPDRDPRKAAAVVQAAFAWYLDIVNLEQHLADELAAARQLEKARDDADWDSATATIRKISTAKSWHDRQTRKRPARTGA